MANHASHASLPFPVKGARYTILVPYLDADGDPTDPTTPDTEVSEDGAAFTDTTEEVTTISGSNGFGYITLTGAETDCSILAVAAKVASGPKATLAMLQPQLRPTIQSGTAQAGAAGTLTLSTGALQIDDYYNGMIVKTTGGTGGGGTGGANNQARVITDYAGSTRVATVSPNWETTPSSDTTYDVLHTEHSVAKYGDLQAWRGSQPNALTSSRVDASVGAMASGTITSTAIASGALTATGIASDAFTAAKFAADVGLEFADAIWDEAASGHTTAGTYGQFGQVLRNATAQAGAAGTITLDASASATDDFYNSSLIQIIAGTGANQSRTITDYTGSSKVATVSPNWVTNPASDSQFVIRPVGQQSVTAPTAAELADAVWDEAVSGHVTAGTFGQRLAMVESGTAQAGAASTITLASGESATDDAYNYNLLMITGGTGAGQARFITDYVGSSKVATVNRNWTTNPSSDSVYVVLPGDVLAASGTVDANVISISGDTTAADNLESAFDGTGYTSALTVQSVSDMSLRRATAQAGSTTTITLDASASSTNDYYTSQTVAIVAGTGAGQARLINAYVGATKVATVSPAFATAPSSGSTFVVLPMGAADVETWLRGTPNALSTGRVDASVGTISSGAITATSIATGAITAAKFAAGAIDAAAIADSAIDAGALATGAITSTKFAASAIDSTVLANNAITASKLATDAIGASQIASGALTSAKFATGALTSTVFAADSITAAAVAADVGAEIGVAVWATSTSSPTAGSYGQYNQPLHAGTAQAGANGSITLASGASAVNDYYLNAVVQVIGGTGAGQAHTISGYVGASKVASITPNWGTNPDNTSVYVIQPVGAISGASAPSAADVADAVWDESAAAHVTAGTFGQRLFQVRSATAQAGAAGTITLDASASATNDFYNDALIVITGGTGANQSRTISDYVGASKVANVTPNWITTPASDSVFVIVPAGAIAGATAPTAGQVASAVWDEARAGHVGAGTYGADLALSTQVDGLEADTASLLSRLTSQRATNLDNLDASVNSRATAADVNAQVLDVLTVDLFAEIGSVPAATSTLLDKFRFLFLLARNKMTATGSELAVRNDADSANVGTASVSDDGTTATKGEWGS